MTDSVANAFYKYRLKHALPASHTLQAVTVLRIYQYRTAARFRYVFILLLRDIVSFLSSIHYVHLDWNL
jgi:hypothetical protein